MKMIFLFFLVPVIAYGQVTREENFDLVVDSSPEINTIKPSPGDTVNRSNKNKVFIPFLELSFGNIWSKYTEFPDKWWKYSIRLGGYGICGGLLFYPKKFLRIETGIRFHRMGNKINIHIDGYIYDYDTLTWEHTDSTLWIDDGFFKQDQFYLSVPFSLNVYLKGLPVYLLGGIELGYLLRTSYYSELVSKSENGDIQYSSWSGKKDKNLYRPFDFNFNIGSGASINLNNRLDIDIQLIYSAGPFLINDPDFWGVKFKSREVSLRILMIYYRPINKRTGIFENK